MSFSDRKIEENTPSPQIDLVVIQQIPLFLLNKIHKPIRTRMMAQPRPQKAQLVKGSFSKNFEAVEAAEPHWQRLDRLTAASGPSSALRGGRLLGGGAGGLRIPPTSTSPIEPDYIQHKPQLPQSSSDGVAAPYTSTGAAAAASSASSAATVLHNELTVTQHRYEQDQKHFQQLQAMRSRNEKEFLKREEELLQELEQMPQLQAAAANERSLRLAKELHVVEESEVEQLRKTLFLLDQRLTRSTENEAVSGAAVVVLAESASVGEKWLRQAAEVLNLTLHDVRGVPSVIAELRAHASNAPVLHGSKPAPPLLEMAENPEGLFQAETAPIPSVELPPAADASAKRLAADVTAALKEAHQLRLYVTHASDAMRAVRARWERSTAELEEKRLLAQEQLDAQTLAMDEAHATLTDLSHQRDEYQAAVEAADKRIATLVASISEDAAVAQRNRERRQALEQQRANLEQERTLLVERQRKTRQEMANAELEKQQTDSTIASLQSSFRQLREEATAERHRGDTLEADALKQTRSLREMTAAEEEVRTQCTRLRHKLDTQKGLLADLLARVTTTHTRQDELEAEERSAARETTELRLSADEADRHNSHMTTEVETLNHETQRCGQDILELRQALRHLERQEGTLLELQRDVDAELDMTRAVLLYQEESDVLRPLPPSQNNQTKPTKDYGSHAKSTSNHAQTKTTLSALDASPRGILRGSGGGGGGKGTSAATGRMESEKEPPASRRTTGGRQPQQETFATLQRDLRERHDEPDPIAPPGGGAAGGARGEGKQSHHHRLKSWSRSSSQRAEETPSRSESRATTTTLYVDDDVMPSRHSDMLDTPQQAGAPPSTSTLWRSPASTATPAAAPPPPLFSPPRLVTLAPRNFTRDHAALQETRELLQRLDDDERLMMESDQNEQPLPRVVHLGPRGLEGLRTSYDTDSTSHYPQNGEGRGTAAPSESVYAPAVFLTRTLPRVPPHQQHDGLSNPQRPLLSSSFEPHPAEPSRRSLSVESDTAAPTTAPSHTSTWFSSAPSEPNTEEGEEAEVRKEGSETRAPSSVRDRLSKLQSKLTASVAENPITSSKRRPFR